MLVCDRHTPLSRLRPARAGTVSGQADALLLYIYHPYHGRRIAQSHAFLTSTPKSTGFHHQTLQAWTRTLGMGNCTVTSSTRRYHLYQAPDGGVVIASPAEEAQLHFYPESLHLDTPIANLTTTDIAIIVEDLDRLWHARTTGAPTTLKPTLAAGADTTPVWLPGQEAANRYNGAALMDTLRAFVDAVVLHQHLGSIPPTKVLAVHLTFSYGVRDGMGGYTLMPPQVRAVLPKPFQSIRTMTLLDPHHPLCQQASARLAGLAEFQHSRTECPSHHRQLSQLSKLAQAGAPLLKPKDATYTLGSSILTQPRHAWLSLLKDWSLSPA